MELLLPEPRKMVAFVLAKLLGLAVCIMLGIEDHSSKL